jgi:hypothetical protein
MRRRFAIALLAILAATYSHEAAAGLRVLPSKVIFQTDGRLKEQVKRLAEALNKRDLEVIKSQIAPSRIYVEVSDKAGAYLSSSQTLVFMETFLRSRNAVNAVFEFVSDDGVIGSASGSLTARKDGRLIRYKLNFGFTKSAKGDWQLNRISMR